MSTRKVVLEWELYVVYSNRRTGVGTIEFLLEYSGMLSLIVGIATSEYRSRSVFVNDDKRPGNN